MANALVPSARVVQARAQLYALTERWVLENLAADNRRGRDLTKNLNQLLELQALKVRLGLQQSQPG